MKNILFIFFLIIFNTTFSQDISVTRANELNKIAENGNGIWVKNSEKQSVIKGSPYLFDSWNNISKFYTSTNSYTIPNFNYNIDKERFEAKYSADSIFILNTNNIDKLDINNVIFQPFIDVNTGRRKFYEIVGDIKDFVILKDYKVNIVEGTLNPLTQEKTRPDEYRTVEMFYVKEKDDNNLKELKLNKKSILNLVETRQVEIKKYVKGKNLKYNNIVDVQKILTYYSTLDI